MRGLTLTLGLLTLACQSSPSPPIGSLENPVRADAFRGELEYLGRLRCPDGTSPQTQGLIRRHSRPGHLIEGFRVRCIYLNREVVVFFDSNHPGHRETRAVPGFTLSEVDPWRSHVRAP